MAIGVVKLTKNGRKTLVFLFTVLNIIQVLLGCGIAGPSLYIFISIAPIIFTETTQVRFVFATTGLFGTHVIFHWLLGLKICQKCFKQAHKKSTRKLLLLWSCAGTNTMINLIIIASLSRKINKHLSRSMKNSLQNSMKNYLKDETSKYSIDMLQYYQECCGIYSYEDWHEVGWLNKYQLDVSSKILQELIAINKVPTLTDVQQLKKCIYFDHINYRIKFLSARYRKSEDNLHLPVTPWSCCKVNFPMQCLHDPLQQQQFAHVWKDEPSVVTDSININGCLDLVKKPISVVITLIIILVSCISILHILIFLIARILYTGCRNLILLENENGITVGWIFGRGDCGWSRGKTLSEMMINIPEQKTKSFLRNSKEKSKDTDESEKTTPKKIRLKIGNFNKFKKLKSDNSESIDETTKSREHEENDILLNLK